jgi:intracellular multiplication protein IcmP
MQGQKGNDYGDFMMLFIIGVVILLMMFSKYLFYYYLFAWKAVIIPVVFIIKFMPSFSMELLFFWAPSGITDTAEKIYKILISTNNGYFVDRMESYKMINKQIGLWIKPYILMFFAYSIYIIFNKRNFNKRYLKHGKQGKTSVDQLLEQEAAIWPSIKIMINEHPELVGSLDEGKWAMSKRPEKFVKDFDLLDYTTDENDEKFFSLNEERTFKVLNKQMGKPWTGLAGITKYEKQMLAIILPKLMRQTAENKAVIALLGTYYTSEKVTMFNYIKFRKNRNKTDKVIDATVKKYIDKEPVKEVIAKHFYKKTVFAALLEKAREDGVLATCEFQWFKIRDRELWYMLNNVGRKSSFVECCAPWAHFLAEKSLERKIANPMIANALIAIDQDLYDSNYDYKRIFSPDSDVVE